MIFAAATMAARRAASAARVASPGPARFCGTLKWIPMRYVDNRGLTDPRVNLALEEYVLRHRFPGEECLLFYINEPSIIIGRNQNTIEEIDPDAVEARGIHVVRRVSGGGAEAPFTPGLAANSG